MVVKSSGLIHRLPSWLTETSTGVGVGAGLPGVLTVQSQGHVQRTCACFNSLLLLFEIPNDLWKRTLETTKLVLDMQLP